MANDFKSTSQQFIVALDNALARGIMELAIEGEEALKEAVEDIGIFVANPDCCPYCDSVDGHTVSLSIPLEEFTHPHCKCHIRPLSEDIASSVKTSTNGNEITYTIKNPHAQDVEFGTPDEPPHPVLRVHMSQEKQGFVPNLFKKLQHFGADLLKKLEGFVLTDD